MTERYAHLDPERLQSAVDGLNFGVKEEAEVVAIHP